MNQKVSSGSGVVEVENKETMDLCDVDGRDQEFNFNSSMDQQVLAESQDAVMSQRVGNTMMMKKLFGLK